MDDTASISSTTAAPDYAGRKLTVMGLGRFGGGAGVVRFLAQHGALVTLTDLKTADELADSDPAAATRIRQGIVTLYADKKWAGDLVDRARASLSGGQEM